MIIILQYTLTDIRKFAKSQGLLLFPTWPNPVPYKQFVRGNGRVVPKNDNALTTYLGKTCVTENLVCKINKGIKVPKVISEKNPNDLMLFNRINHYFSDGGVLTKFEFVFELRQKDVNLSYRRLKSLLNTILNSKIKIRNHQFKYDEYSFKNAFAGLRKLQIISTTSSKYVNDAALEKFIIKCTPQIFVSLNRKEFIAAPTRNKVKVPLSSLYDSALTGWWEDFNNNPYKIWMLSNKDAESDAMQKGLRSGILRIHAEKECINNVIQSFLSGFLSVAPNTPESEYLQHFLNNKIRDVDTNFKKMERMDASRKLETFIKQAYDRFDPGEITALSRGMEELGFRPQIESKVTKYIVKHANYIENQNISQQNVENQDIMNDNSQNMRFGDKTNINAPINQTQTNNANTYSDGEWKTFYNELSAMIADIKTQQESYDKEVALLNLEEARKATVKKDQSGFMEGLKKAGSWVADLGAKVGASVITEIIKKQIS